MVVINYIQLYFTELSTITEDEPALNQSEKIYCQPFAQYNYAQN
jgi:hypothetical protein